MYRAFTLYTDQLRRIPDRVDENAKKNPLALCGHPGVR
ncbi:hypothetical protein P22_0830 [Propionispora sp. 2/2-37]|nr:hypothetical protein P22_0830 [Propionispora sp. 2/2-37]